MRKIVTRILAAAFLGFILTVMCVTLVKYGRNYAYGFFKSYTDQLDGDSDVFDRISARIYKLEYNTENRLFGRDTLRHLSARLQLLPGKELVNVSDVDMVKLSSGGWYNVVWGEYDPGQPLKLIELSDYAADIYGSVSLLAYCHCGLYEDNLLPGDIALIDNNNEYADKILAEFAGAGIPYTDSRITYKEHGLTMDNAVNKSDLHWTHLLALDAACDTVKQLNAAYGLRLDETALDAGRFTLELHENLLAGEFARRVGAELVEADDVYVLYPAYETHIVYEELGDDSARREGAFEEAVLNRKNLACDEGEAFSSNAYYIYGHYLAQTRTINESAPDVTVLVFKDSYGSPLSAFLSLAAREVVSVDPRSTNDSPRDWIDRIQPDVIIYAYSEQTFRNTNAVIAAD